MNHRSLKKIDLWIAAWGAIAIVLAAVISGKTVFISALLGAALGLANWVIFRYVVLRMAVAGNKLGFGIFVGVKSLAILGIITVAFMLLPLNAPAFSAGISSLFMGILSYFLIQNFKKGDRFINEESENA